MLNQLHHVCPLQTVVHALWNSSPITSCSCLKFNILSLVINIVNAISSFLHTLFTKISSFLFWTVLDFYYVFQSNFFFQRISYILKFICLSHSVHVCVCTCMCMIVWLTFLVNHKLIKAGTLSVFVIQLLSHVWLFVTPWTAAHQDPLFFTICLSLLKLMSIELVMPSNHLILCCPLLLLTSIFPSVRVFSNELLFPSGGQSTEASALAPVPPMNIQG